MVISKIDLEALSFFKTILKSSLVSLNMKSLKEITFGSVFIVENKELCYVDNIDWRPIAKSTNRNRITKKFSFIDDYFLFGYVQ